MDKFGWLKERLEFFTILTLGIVAVWTIKSDIHNLDQKLSGDIHALDQKLSGDIHALDQKLSGDLYSLDQRLTDKINGLDNRLTSIETTLLIKGFTSSSVSISDLND